MFATLGEMRLQSNSPQNDEAGVKLQAANERDFQQPFQSVEVGFKTEDVNHENQL